MADSLSSAIFRAKCRSHFEKVRQGVIWQIGMAEHSSRPANIENLKAQLVEIDKELSSLNRDGQYVVAQRWTKYPE